MELRQIRHFLAVMEHGNVLRASAAIHLSQPALSKSIQNLESELGVPLLTRGPRGVTPTIYGEVLLRHARLLHNQGEQAVAEIRALQAGSAGHLRLGVANFAITFLPRVLAQLLASTPGLSFEIVDGTYEDLTALIRQGALDAAVSGFPPLHQADDLVHQKLVAEEFLVVCRKTHPVLTLDGVTPRDLARYPWILADHPRAVIELVELVFRGAGATPPRPRIGSGSMTFLKAVLLEGDFLTVLPRGLVAEELEAGTLVTLPFAGRSTPTIEGIIYRAEAVHPPALYVLIDAIKAEHAAIQGRTGEPRALLSKPARATKQRRP